MLARYSVKDLYPPALAEGEGMGTAYEYYVKRMALGRFLAGRPRPKSVLIAGLPQKYGASLDFMLLASELGAEVTVIDDRGSALERLRDGLAVLAKMADAPPINPPAATILTDLETPALGGACFDLILSSEVLQRLTPEGRRNYVTHLRRLAPTMALFCPNAGNEAHNSRSGLGGLSLEELRALAGEGGGRVIADYIDMPPFPPGITRSAEQRDEATSGRFEAFVMWGLGVYARAERVLPGALRRRHAHIVYAFVSG